MIVSLIIIIITIICDQLSKYFIFGAQPHSVIGELLWFQSEKNTGAAFSMLSGNNVLFIIITLIATAILFYFIFSKNILTKKLEKISLSLIVGGAIGNLIDRILFAYVRDFIYLKFINFAVFNIADSAITIGAILLIISILFFNKKEEKNGRT